MSAVDAVSAVIPSLETSDGFGSNADRDRDLLASYLALEEPRLVLDVRPDSAFHLAHLVGSYHISPIPELKSRYSYLPPRNTPFLVVADHNQHDEASGAFAQVPSASLVFLAPDISESTSAACGHIVPRQAFLASAQRLGLLRKSHSHHSRIAATPESDTSEAARDDVPHLLFRPSNAVRRTVLRLEGDQHHNHDDTLSVLDLGCGAARDLAWILHGSRTRRPSCSWTGIGVDNWKAALNRAEQLMHDLLLDHRSHEASTNLPSLPRCDKLVWAKCSDQGFLEPLVGTGKGKSIRTRLDDQQLWQQCQQLGLSPFLPCAENDGPVQSTSQQGARFDLILCIRFHPRPLLPRLPRLVRPGGIVLLSHFVTLSDAQRSEASQAYPDATIDYDSPPHEGRLQPEEVESLVRTWNQSELPGYGWIIDSDVLEPIEDGRIIRSVALRRLAV